MRVFQEFHLEFRVHFMMLLNKISLQTCVEQNDKFCIKFRCVQRRLYTMYNLQAQNNSYEQSVPLFPIMATSTPSDRDLSRS